MELTVKKYNELTADELYDILRARAEIFIVEQNCAYQDLDFKDKKAYHVYLKDKDGIVAYLRVLEAGVSYDEVCIGRVITVKRGQGFGAEILKAGIKVAKEKLGANAIIISAQLYAKGFYEKGGFRQISDQYLEDGIPHIRMRCDL